ncbi:flagellar transcriptional regulator FlhD [Cupriavidus numazuensis]|uniref:Flagellar transcriptional regulator FlhD n=1 Tax=Cupriavidus numazuensis TaxID=221992 RepID=A0ABN7QBN2_9BURK|nr:flagellar transcriptional regulator FlhD [Cupriavidus numazuensis]CAG2161015.1 Flagellar transcriptional regulator FlhD [Cupriavidus numazuensis]
MCTADLEEFNLSYLLLAQKLAREDKLAAAYRLGVSPELAELLGKLTTAQVIKLAASGALICDFRITDASRLNVLVTETPAIGFQSAHAAILLAQQQVRSI